MCLIHDNLAFHNVTEPGSLDWLWLDGSIPPTPLRVQFRAQVELPDETAALALQISCGGRFRLYVEGKEALSGPWRGDAAHVPVDKRRVEISKGRHILAAEVLWYGEWAPAGIISPGRFFCAPLRRWMPMAAAWEAFPSHGKRAGMCPSGTMPAMIACGGGP